MKKQKGYIDVWPRLTLEPNEDYEYEIFYGRHNDLNSGQAKFILVPESVEDLFKLIGYLTSRGWFNKIEMDNLFLPNRFKVFWMHCRKKRKTYDKKPTANDLDNDGCLEVWVVVDRKRLNEFRELLKEIPDFEVTWTIDPKNGIDIIK